MCIKEFPNGISKRYNCFHILFWDLMSNNVLGLSVLLLSILVHLYFRILFLCHNALIGGSRTAFFSIAYISPWLYCAYFLHFTCIRFMVSIFLSFNIIITFNLEKVLIYLHMNLLTLLHFILKLWIIRNILIFSFSTTTFNFPFSMLTTHNPSPCSLMVHYNKINDSSLLLLMLAVVLH